MAETVTRDNLIFGDFPLVTSSETLDTGNLARGCVLGKKTAGAVPTTGTADGGNTGDGTVTSVTGGVNVKAGTYTLECIEAATNGGTFKVTNPTGSVIAIAIITGGAGGTATVATDEINATITDGATDFAVADKFTVAVPAGDGKVVAVDSTAIDGSAQPYGVLAEDADASSADVVTTAYLTGQFNELALTFGSGTIATYRDAMRERSMFVRQSVAQ